MFGLGGQELLLILFIVLLFFGPSKLPELAKGLGRGMREFKKAQADLEHEFNKVVESSDVKDNAVATNKDVPKDVIIGEGMEKPISESLPKESEKSINTPVPVA